MTFIKEVLTQAKTDVETMISQGALPNDVARKILQRYSAAIEGNFVAWMGATVITARSVQGRYAASENLWVEMKDDHAGMLRAFAKNAGAEPNVEDYQYVDAAVQSARQMVAEMSGLKNLALMAVLENTSAAFIPWLASLAKQLGATDFTYTDVHGEADIMHADQFAWALEHESEQHERAKESVRDAVDVTVKFLSVLFQVHA